MQQPVFQLVENEPQEALEAHQKEDKHTNHTHDVQQRLHAVERRISRLERALVGIKRGTDRLFKRYGLGMMAFLSVGFATVTLASYWQSQKVESQRQAHALSLLLLDKVSSEDTDQWQRRKNLALLAQAANTPLLKRWAASEERQAATEQITSTEVFPTPVHTQLNWPLGSGAPSAADIIYEPYRQGISVKANLGDPIVAVEDGKVVYSSNEIPGYGNLIIIEHSGDLMSIYGHNYANYVEKGDHVYRGQLIAVAGELPSTEPGLYFEIRNQGKPENPFSYLQPL